MVVLTARSFLENGFWMEMHPFIKYTLTGDDVGRITRHQQVLEGRVGSQQVLGKVASIHLGHDNVGHKQVDHARVRARHPDDRPSPTAEPHPLLRPFGIPKSLPAAVHLLKALV